MGVRRKNKTVTASRPWYLFNVVQPNEPLAPLRLTLHA
jgi:hypothetical protein